MDEEAAAAGAAAAEKFAATEPSLRSRHAIPDEELQDWWGASTTRPSPIVAVRRRFAPLGKLPIAGAALVIVAAVVFLLVNTGGPHQPNTGGGIAGPSAGPLPCCESGTLPPTPGHGTRQPGPVGATGPAGPSGSAGPIGTALPVNGRTTRPAGSPTPSGNPPGSPAPPSMGDGQYTIGTDVSAGTYTAHAAPAACSWTIQHPVGLVGGLLGGGQSSGGGAGDHTVNLQHGDKFTTAHCGTWWRQT